MKRRFIALGAGALAAGLLLVTVASMPSHTSSVYAGADVCVTFTPTKTPTKTATPGSATATNTPGPTNTPTNTPIPPTNTPTNTPIGFTAFGNTTAQKTCVATSTTTPLATNTLVPAATTAPPVATATKTGGNLGGGVRPPDTGSGGFGSDGASGLSALLIAGIALVALGGGTVLAGVRTRK